MRLKLRNILHFTATLLLGLLITIWLSLMANAQAETFGDQSLGWTTSQQQAVAGYLKRRLQASDQVFNNIWVEYWLAERAEHLRQAATLVSPSLSVVLIKDFSFNAFALPGNVMGFHLGLFNLADNEDEFVSVLAHELAHIQLRHFSRLVANNRQQSWLAISGIILGLGLMSVNTDLGAATLLSSQASSLQQSLSFTRSMESEADALSSRLLQETGYDAYAGSAIFNRLSQQQADPRGASDYWQTHPRLAIRGARLGTNNTANTDASIDNQPYQIIRWYLNQTLKLTAQNIKEPDFLQISRADDHGSLPTKLLERAEPNELYGWVIMQSNEADSGIQIERLQQLTTLFPDFDPAWFQLAKLHSLENCETALTLLNNIKATYLEVLELKRQLSLSCKPEQAAENSAWWYWHTGEENKAFNLLKRAIAQPQDATQLARLRELLTHFERQIALLPT